METSLVRFRGVAFEFGERIIIVPPLSVGQMEEHAEKLDALGSTPDQPRKLKEMGAFIKENGVPVITAAVRRNYPGFTDTEAADFVTAENWGELVSALLGNSRKPKVRTGEPFPVGALIESSASPTLTGADSAPA